MFVKGSNNLIKSEKNIIKKIDNFFAKINKYKNGNPSPSLFAYCLTEEAEGQEKQDHVGRSVMKVVVRRSLSAEEGFENGAVAPVASV